MCGDRLKGSRGYISTKKCYNYWFQNGGREDTIAKPPVMPLVKTKKEGGAEKKIGYANINLFSQILIQIHSHICHRAQAQFAIHEQLI